MKLKLDEDGHVVVEEGMPVYIHDDENKTEAPFDVMAAASKITNLNAEAKKHRLEKNEAVEKLALFEGIEDPEAAKKAIETVANLDTKKLVDAGEIDTLKRQMGEAFESERVSLVNSSKQELKTKDTIINGKDEQIYKLMVSSQFAKSPFFSGEKPITILPPDVASEYFGKYFKVEESENQEIKVVGYMDGEKIPSRKNFGEPADFEEALTVIIDKYAFKDRIISAGPEGAGGAGGNKGGLLLEKTIKESDTDGFNTNLEEIAKGNIKVEM